MKYKIKIIISLIISFLLGTALTLLIWISLASFFEIKINIVLLVFLIVVSVFTLQSKSTLVLACNIGAYLAGVLLSFAIELNMDLLHKLYKCRGVAMSVGDGFGVYIYVPLFMCAIFIVILLASISTFIRVLVNKKKRNIGEVIERNKR